ncbi:hypothetical protein DNO_1156 [Dichelobacter nodosus VCS1703A]|uniref:Uncharacterized protein n=1 Tax=Dichelobacter nodosus (strain VCS1703A) TaxID=246195 RepID=A5EXJ0_DICNV|nr:hypothetical protein DNO_1156 [Dichelobacter nodosus VCS1703A]
MPSETGGSFDEKNSAKIGSTIININEEKMSNDWLQLVV